jgi:hypothetical protein
MRLLKFVVHWASGVSAPWSTTMTSEALERFVDADEAAKFLSFPRRRILELARAGKLPGHPIGEGARHVWRFRLSELANAVAAAQGCGFSSRRRASMVHLNARPDKVE